MTATGLKSAIDDKFTPSPTVALDAHTLFSEAIKEYLEENCVVTYSWSGVDGGGSPDPITSFIGYPTWSSLLIPVPLSLIDWAVKLTSAIYSAVIIPDDNTFTFSSNLIFGNVPIGLSFSGETDQSNAMLYTCNEIVEGIKDMIAPGSFSGSHGSYTGTATMVSIS